MNSPNISECGSVGRAGGLGAKARSAGFILKNRGNVRKTEEKRAFAVWPTPSKAVWPQFWPVLWELQFHKFFHHRGVAQLVARLVWDQDAAGSSPVTSTKNRPFLRLKPLENGHFFNILHNFWFYRIFWPQFDRYKTGQIWCTSLCICSLPLEQFIQVVFALFFFRFK